jgi:EpsI family protein
MALSIKKWLLLALMLLSAGLGAALRPTLFLADELPPVDLKTMIPSSFGEWQELPHAMTQIVNPQQREILERIYSETLSRTYTNAEGYRVMLSVAYGKNQSKGLELHSPEVCYPAQGFMLTNRKKVELEIMGTQLQSTRLETTLGQRFEPVTFWTAIGDAVPYGTFQKRLVELRFAMTGRIPDGILVRVSSIDPQTEQAYAMQTRFANAMIAAIAPEHRSRFVGKPVQQ